MANRLIERGPDVVSLTILDSDVPDDDATVRESSQTEVVMAFVHIFEQLLERPLHITRGDLEVRSEKAQLELLHGRLVSEDFLPRRSEREMLHGPLRTFAMSALTHYRPDKPYPGSVQLVLLNEPGLDEAANWQRRQDIAKKWKQWAPNLFHLQTPGNHMTALKVPHVFELARLVSNPQWQHKWEYMAEKSMTRKSFVSSKQQ